MGLYMYFVYSKIAFVEHVIHTYIILLQLKLYKPLYKRITLY
jgi:hypothetical protein